MKYIYFISVAIGTESKAETQPSLFYRKEVFLSEPITNIDQLMKIEREINRELYNNDDYYISTLFYSLLRTEE